LRVLTAIGEMVSMRKAKPAAREMTARIIGRCAYDPAGFTMVLACVILAQCALREKRERRFTLGRNAAS